MASSLTSRMDEIELPGRFTPVAFPGAALTGGLVTAAGPLAVRVAAPMAGLAETSGVRFASPEMDARGRTTDPAGFDATESVGDVTLPRVAEGGLALVDAARGLVGGIPVFAGPREARLAAAVPGAAAVTPGRVTAGGFVGGLMVDFLSVDAAAVPVGGFVTVGMPNLGLATAVVEPIIYIIHEKDFQSMTDSLSPYLLHSTIWFRRRRTFGH